MSHNVMLVPTGKASGIFTASLGLVKALNNNGVKAALFRPFFDCCNKECSDVSLNKFCAAGKIAEGKRTEVLERIVANFNNLAKENYDVVVIEGVQNAPFNSDEMNADICHAFDADIITLVSGKCGCAAKALKSTLLYFGNAGKNKHLGSILINHNAPRDAQGCIKLILSGTAEGDSCCSHRDVVENVLVTVDYDVRYYAPTAADLAAYLNTEVASGDDKALAYELTLDNSRVNENSVLLTGSLPASTSAKIVILTDGAKGELPGVTVISTDETLWATAQALSQMEPVLCDCKDRISLIENSVAKAFDQNALDTIRKFDAGKTALMSPAAFRSKLTALARAAHKKIALPEGDEPRTVCAAAKVAEIGRASCRERV